MYKIVFPYGNDYKIKVIGKETFEEVEEWIMDNHSHIKDNPSIVVFNNDKIVYNNSKKFNKKQDLYEFFNVVKKLHNDEYIVVKSKTSKYECVESSNHNWYIFREKKKIGYFRLRFNQIQVDYWDGGASLVHFMDVDEHQVTETDGMYTIIDSCIHGYLKEAIEMILERIGN